jgi:hypothetical protein
MLLIQLALANCATLYPPTTPAMMADFTAVGGLLLLATGCASVGLRCLRGEYAARTAARNAASALWTHFSLKMAKLVRECAVCNENNKFR